MSRIIAVASLCALMTLGACSRADQRPVRTIPIAGSELYGESIRVKASDGRISTMRFSRNGTVTASFGGRELTGRWDVQPRKLCFTWGAVRDCWPYATHFRRGETVSLKSDRGNVVQVTLL